MKFWEELLTEGTQAMIVYAVLRSSIRAVNEGRASTAQKNLVDSFNNVFSELETKALLKQMNAEIADIEDRKQKFAEKWGKYLLPRNAKA